MKKKVVILLVVLAMLMVLPAYAVTPRINDIVPSISYSGTVATCSVSISGDKTTDAISATMELRQGSNVIDQWSGSGYGVLNMTETATVSRWKTYTLYVDVTINGVALPTASTSKFNI